MNHNVLEISFLSNTTDQTLRLTLWWTVPLSSSSLFTVKRSIAPNFISTFFCWIFYFLLIRVRWWLMGKGRSAACVRQNGTLCVSARPDSHICFLLAPRLFLLSLLVGQKIHSVRSCGLWLYGWQIMIHQTVHRGFAEWSSWWNWWEEKEHTGCLIS